MISKEKMDKLVPYLKGGIVAIYILGYVIYDILHVKKTLKKAKKSMK